LNVDIYLSKNNKNILTFVFLGGILYVRKRKLKENMRKMISKGERIR